MPRTEDNDDSSSSSLSEASSGTLRRVSQPTPVKSSKSRAVRTPKTPLKEVQFKANETQPSTPLTPEFVHRFARMATSEPDNKRKDRESWDEVAGEAGTCKCPSLLFEVAYS
ncbi:MAG: hypothetical protein AAFQ92_23370 [Bacteroidota bacterium]